MGRTVEVTSDTALMSLLGKASSEASAVEPGRPSASTTEGGPFVGLAFQPDPERVWQMLQSCPRNAPTPLLCLSDDGVDVWVKDESQRLGLGSFKALGGIYAVAQLVCDEVERRTGERPSPASLQSEHVRKIAGRLTFVCASAGNHGLAVATGARLFGAKARIHLSASVPDSFAERLEQSGAVTCRSGNTYEESLQLAQQDAVSVGGTLLADGSWLGYTYPPSLVMEGYTAIAVELASAFQEKNCWPSDVYLQAGVGGMAAAVALLIRKSWLQQPRIVIVEPSAADCLAISGNAGKLVEAVGPVSNMGRLDCKEASLLAFETLVACDVEYLTISDGEADRAVKSLNVLGIQTSPSGAAGFAGWQRDRALGSSAGQHPMVIVTEQAIG